MSFKALRKAVEKSAKDKFESGTIVRWQSSERYTYAALKTPAGWFTTARPGNPFVPSVLEFEELLEILSRSETSDVVVFDAEAGTPILAS